ncbi:hypothetical protein [Longimicrobium sp.]|uniref:hypothetical protein n=1 Tax=Longimicrobium sp. TaxID=2029185 RepID=UPI002E36E7DE|nr:hypothetical protein [Longimicrobium sp.]HEX6039872.1 hypothetical protein [Longimicrobium sp.]
MRKLNLDLDALVVESFATDRVEAARGTVRANEAVLDSNVYSCKSCFCPSHHQSECCAVY